MWKFRTNGIISTSPKIHNGVIYFGSSDHNFYAIDSRTHAEIWNFRCNDEVVSDALILNDRIYFGSADETLYAVDFNGKLRWGFKTAEQVYNTALAKDGVIYFCGRDRYVYALDAKTGACKWKFMTDADMYCPPLIRNNRIFVGSYKVYALNMEGYKVWEVDVENNTIAMNGELWGNNAIFACFDCTIKSVTFAGQLNWVFRVNGVMIPMEAFLEVLPAPKWNPDLFSPKIVKKSVTFNPYAFDDKGLKIYGGINTTGIEAYAGPRDNAYGEAGMESVAAYQPEKKKNARGGTT